ncbi:hypothetical protein K469DRAFT_278942 [Zopfia rhizophila CBS 207.26]|uniref:Uncharacterized protein n=1 Tax=Zopfia rhizophila CBS 207.26 TaxID=1314779 RepID=A0A6A6DR48_9PEZI|nr:hypothetical protein K469DRAFT_278942 [Zopfia rhizophila CBS 207.26]
MASNQPTEAKRREDTPAQAVVEAVRRADKWCPNRIWALAHAHEKGERALPNLIPSSPGVLEHVPPHADHQFCTFDLCEHSCRDFTAVKRAHEPRDSHCTCKPHNDLFPEAELNLAAIQGQSTAWELAGRSTIKPPQPFMAVSHVWSDGTGTGGWPHGEANQCLYSFFKGIAQRFKCKGIWWDTICIPSGKKERNKALDKMHLNYENARFTLVHDDFLRALEWVDAETACFAIVMSPWFSRGWTALELAMSRKVKILFKGSIIKDLDEDILRKYPDSSTHPSTAEAIRALRDNKGIADVNTLIRILRPRYTSWPKDIATISGLLARVPIGRTESQIIYKDILRKIGRIYHGHLFHDSATMSGDFGWCPTSLLDMPISPPPSASDTFPPLDVLLINEHGTVIGNWDRTQGIGDVCEKTCNWKGTHPLVKAKLCAALEEASQENQKHWTRYSLLVEPRAKADQAITRALLVKVKRQDKTADVEYIGSLHFNQDLRFECIFRQVQARIGGPDEAGKGSEDPGEMDSQTSSSSTGGDDDSEDPGEMDGQTSSSSASGDNGSENPRKMDDSGWNALHVAAWRCCHDQVNAELDKKTDPTKTDTLGQQPIHLAAERGNVSIVEGLLKRLKESDQLQRAGLEYQNAKCKRGQTALHRAVWGVLRKSSNCC